MLRIVVIIVVIALVHILSIVNLSISLGAVGLFYTISAVIIWKTAKLRYVAAGFALAGLCIFGMCGLHLYNDMSWLGVVLAVVMLMVFFGSMEIESRLHPEAMKERAWGGKNDSIFFWRKKSGRNDASNDANDHLNKPSTTAS
jgi:hypothetical protein